LTAVPKSEVNKALLLRQAFQLSTANLVAQAARFIKNFALAGLLEPQLFGLWNGFQVFLLYGTNSHLGILHAINREIPLSRGRGESEIIPHLARVGLTVSLLNSTFIGTILFVIGTFLDSTTIESTALKLLAAVLIAQQLFLFYQFLLRAEDNFTLLSRVLVIAVVVELAASVALVYWLGFNGIFYGLLASSATVLLICMTAERHVVSRLELDFQLIRRLVRIGFPIMLTVLSYGLLTSVDRVMIITFLGSESLGYYAIGPLAITAIGSIPMAITQILFPKSSERYGATDDPESLAGFVRIPTLATAHAMGLVLGLAFILLPLITLLLPKYAPGIPAARILFVGFYFFTLQGPCANLLITINRQMQYLARMLSALALGVALIGTALIIRTGIEGVAVATAMTYTGCALAVIGFSVRTYLPAGYRRFRSFLGKTLLPGLIAAVTTFVALQIQLEGLLSSIMVQALAFIGIYGITSFFLLRRELPK
jgi:O-antigen/teichoic acid export membrane protein